MFEIADVSDSEKLTEIAMQSKSYWGYSKELLESWRNDLTVTVEMLRMDTVYTYCMNNEVVGFYVLNTPIEDSIELEMLFVLPTFIGKKIGKIMLQHAVQKAKIFKVNTMTLLADPNAVKFYESQGFYQTGKQESSIPNRFLPTMQKDL